jgi:flagellar hook protein FlgE
MGSALWIAISGLNASSKQMDVIGNNIANSSTMGFKTGKTYFANVLSQSLSGGASGAMQIGQGVTVADVATQFSQGSLESTSSGLDLAIDGGGFFVVEDAEGSQYFTRAGAFHIDGDGYLVDIGNNRVQGYAPSSPTLGDLNTRNSQSAPDASANFSVGLNLDARTDTGGVFNSSQTVYDTLGTAHTLAATYTKTAAAGNWGLAVTLDGAAAASQNYTGFIFDGNGDLDKVYNAGNLATGGVDPANITVSFTGLANGATIGTAGTLTWDLTSATHETISGYAATSTVKALTNDGYPSGLLRSLSVEKDGNISGFFTNGQTASLGQIALADFPNPWGLKKMGSNLFSSTLGSGQAIINTPGAGGLGEVTSNALEMSNTDLGTEFINMITAQRAYQASAKVITTADDMMSALMNTKR